MKPLISTVPGKCSACGGLIRRGEEFSWGQGRGERIHIACGEVEEEYVPDPNRVWSEQQEVIFDWGLNGRGSAVVQAVAGSGKTSTIEELCRRLPTTLSIKYLVFNKDNAKEAVKRMPRHVDVSTFHSCGLSALRNRGRVRVDERKTRKLFLDAIDFGRISPEEAERLGPSVQKLLGLAKRYGIGVLSGDEMWGWLIRHFGIEIERDEIDRAIEIAAGLLEASNARTDVIDFDDMLYLPLLLGCPFERYDVVASDESQDSNPARRAILKQVLKPGGRLIAVGDPRQAIYGFTGADSDAVDIIRDEFGAITLPLSTNYRCSKAVIRAAKGACPELTAWDGAAEGSVVTLDKLNGYDFLPTDAVLCRVNAPLITLAYRLLKAGIPAKVKGRDIGEGLVTLIAKLAGKKPITLDELMDRLEAYGVREIARCTLKDENQKAQVIEDKVESIKAAVESLPETSRTVAGLVDHISNLFTDTGEGMVTLSTIHKAKGLEWPRVFILDPERMPSKWAKRDWEKQQEANLEYVAMTRAQIDLRYINLDAIEVGAVAQAV